MINLFSPYKIKNVELKNRIVMSPMCMYSSDESGIANDWHLHHLLTRAIGGVGLIMQEATAVSPAGRITESDLGIWSDFHIPKLKEITEKVQNYGVKIGIQLGHAGRKANITKDIYGPGNIPYNDQYKTPSALTIKQITEVILSFKEAAIRAGKAGYDVIEIHAAHGYLLSSFLSPLTNKRNDRYGGGYWNRFRLLEEVILEIREVWQGPLFVRISANEYLDEGNKPEDFIEYSKRMKDMGVDLVDCSSGAVAPSKIEPYVGYQVSYAEIIKREANVPTGAVGLIYSYSFADEIIRNKRSDLVFIGRALLREPYWALCAANSLDYDTEIPKQYDRAFSTGRVSN